jgi:HEPN domain-containing protein
MNEQPEVTAIVRGWMEKAENDLRTAEYVLGMEQDCPTDTVCLHCQQSAEKYLKALLVYRGIAFPKTHDLVVLVNLLGKESGFELNIEEVQPLNRYSVEARYPGDWDPIDMPEALESARMARGVRDAVRRLLPDEVS